MQYEEQGSLHEEVDGEDRCVKQEHFHTGHPYANKSTLTCEIA